MADRTDHDFLDDLAANVATLEADVLPPPVTVPRTPDDLEWTQMRAVPPLRLFLGLTASVWVILFLSFGSAGFCLYKHYTQEPRYKVVTTPISKMELGDNVPGINPQGHERSDSDQRIDPATHREVNLIAYQRDGSRVELKVIRSEAWLSERRVSDGENVAVRFDELGVRGLAKLEAIRACPTIRPGPGQTVTGIFRHFANEVMTLTTENGERLGVTPNHRFWSEDRQDFIPAEELHEGESLRLINGTTRLVSLTRRAAGSPVYNLEVQFTHVFHVGQSGLLVHNTGGIPCDIAEHVARGDMHITNTVGAGAARTPRHHIFPQEHRQWFKDRNFDIDKVTVELDQGTHSALHSMGWNENVMGQLMAREKELGRQLTNKEIWEIGNREMRKAKIGDLPILPFND